MYALNMRPLQRRVLIDFSLTVKAATLIFISGRGSAISSASVLPGKSDGDVILCLQNYQKIMID